MFQKEQQYVLKMCPPAKLYLALSLFSIFTILLQNVVDSSKYCLGKYSCDLDFSNIIIFAVKLVYVAIFTIVIDSLCKNKFEKLAWFLVLLPFILMFLLLFGFISLRNL